MKKLILLLVTVVLVTCFTTPVSAKTFKPTDEDAELVAKVIQLENGSGSLKTRVLTAVALVNRAKYCPWCPNTIYGCIMQSNPWQYATSTRNGLSAAKVTASNLRIAKKALRGGYKTPHNMIYQSQFRQGKYYWDNGKGEYFGLDNSWKPEGAS